MQNCWNSSGILAFIWLYRDPDGFLKACLDSLGISRTSLVFKVILLSWFLTILNSVFGARDNFVGLFLLLGFLNLEDTVRIIAVSRWRNQEIRNFFTFFWFLLSSFLSFGFLKDWFLRFFLGFLRWLDESRNK